MAEIKRFVADKLPLDVASLDMDWRALPEPTTGYEVNTKDFPNMTAFAAFVHSLGKQLFFNDHPTGRAPQMNPVEVDFRYDGLTKIMDLGLDFWWFDCHWKEQLPAITIPANATSSTVDYITWGQYIFRGAQERYNREKRPNVARTVNLGCSTSDRWGSHRTPVWWTGDVQWTQLAKAITDEVEGGVDYMKPFVHPDCGGHHGPSDHGEPYPPEVYLRWAGFCALGTVFRIHSDPPGDRRPWQIGDQPATEDAVRAFIDMRMRLVPTLVAAAQTVTATGMPLVRRLDIGGWPDAPQAQATRTDQYLLGDDILVAPVDPFANGGSNATGWNRAKSVWLPPLPAGGAWVDAWDGKAHAGNATVALHDVPADRVPMFRRTPGAAVLARPGAQSVAEIDWRDLVLEAFAPVAAATTDDAMRRSFWLPHGHGAREGAEGEVSVSMTRRGDVVRLALRDGRPAVAGAAWTVRVHLPRGETLRVSSVPGARVLGSSADASTVAAVPFAGPGAPALALGGDVVELRLDGGGTPVIELTVGAKLEPSSALPPANSVGAWVYDVKGGASGMWSEAIARFNSKANHPGINVVYSYGGDMEYYPEPTGPQTYFPPANQKAAQMYRNATAGVDYVVVVIDGRMDGGQSWAPNLSKLSQAAVEAWADETASLLCSFDFVDGVQIDLEPFVAPYAERLTQFIARLSADFRSAERNCVNDAHPNGRSVSAFMMATALSTNVWEALGPNGYATISGYDLSAAPAGTPSTIAYYTSELGKAIDAVRASQGTGSTTKKWMLGIPGAASCHEFEEFTLANGTVVHGHPQIEYVKAAQKVMREKKLDADETFLGPALWGFSSAMAYPPHSNNIFTPGTPFIDAAEEALLEQSL